MSTLDTAAALPNASAADQTGAGAGAPARALALILLLFSLFILLATAYHANRLRIENLATHRTIAEGLARVSEREVTQTLRAVDRLLTSRLEQWPAAERTDSASFSALLRRDLAGLPAVRTLSIIAQDGRIVASSVAGSTGKRLDPAALSEITAGTDTLPTAISRPWRGHELTNGEASSTSIDASRNAYFFTMSQEGVAAAKRSYSAAVINPDFFASFLANVAGQPEYVVELYRYDGTLLLSTRPDSRRPGSSEATHPIFSRLLADSEIGVVDEANGDDRQIIAYRASRRYPLVVEVRVPHRAALAGWRSEMRNLALAAGLALIFIAILATLLQRYNLRRGKEQESARQAIELTARVFESSYDGIFITDAERRFLRINQAFTAITGYSEGQALGQTLRMLACAPHDDAFFDEIWAAVDKDGRWQGEVTCQRRDGTPYAERLSISTVRDGSGKVSNYIGAFIDISAVREHEAALRQAKELAEAANLAKSQFLATMSHELRTPMNAILGMAQLQLLPGNSEAENLQYSRTILDAGNTLLTLLNDILDLAKVEAGGLELADGVINPESILNEVGALFSHGARSKGLSLEVRWQGPTSCSYRGDAIRLRQILSNLISNAIKFTDNGEIRISGGARTLAGERPGLWFEVVDTGIGIATELQSALFKPFAQVDASATRRFGGTGLGLSIVRRLAELMGGEAGLESREGEGSRFWFTIRASAADPAPQVSSAAPTGGGQTHVATEDAHKVLVVEDDPVNRKLLELMLSKSGYRVSTASNGEEALASLAAAQAPPDLILMDCHMPVMDGYQATRRIRQREAAQGEAHIPIIAITAEAFEHNRERCEQAGMDDFLQKPVNLETLRRTLAGHLEKATKRAATA